MAEKSKEIRGCNHLYCGYKECELHETKTKGAAFIKDFSGTKDCYKVEKFSKSDKMRSDATMSGFLGKL